MLSKAKGQVLRVAAALNVMFNDSCDEDEHISVSDVPSTISNESIVAAQNFVDLCCQHAAYIAGRGKVEDEISKVTSACKLYQGGYTCRAHVKGLHLLVLIIHNR